MPCCASTSISFQLLLLLSGTFGMRRNPSPPLPPDGSGGGERPSLSHESTHFLFFLFSAFPFAGKKEVNGIAAIRKKLAENRMM